MNLFFKYLLFLFLLLNLSFANDKQRVLILHSYHEDFKWTNDINKGISQELSNIKNLETYVEYMDTKRFVEKDYYKKLSSLYSTKYKDIKFDLIISSDNNAFNFLKKHTKDIFKDSPVVFCGVNYLKKEYVDGFENFTGVNEKSDIKRNIDLILRIHKDTKNIVVVVDKTTTGTVLKKELTQLIPKYINIEIKVLDDVTEKEIENSVKRLEDRTIILMMIFFRSKDDKFYEYYEIPNLINANASVPMYGLWDFNIGNGIIGGYLTSGYFQGQKAAKLGKKILDGKEVKDIPLVFTSPNKYIFDYIKLQEFNIDTKVLPLDSIIINKPQTFYELYKKEIITLGIIFIIMLVLIVFLLINIYQRRKAQNRIKRQLTFQQDLIDSVHAPIYYKNKKGKYLGCNEAFETLFNLNKSEIVNKSIYDISNEKEIAISHNKKDKEVLKTKVPQEYEATHIDGKDLVIHKSVFYEDNKVKGIIGVIFDITELKKITSELNELNKHLELKVEQRTEQLKVINEELANSNEELQTTIEDLEQTQEQLVESEKMASLGGLVAGVAHEINTPVGVSITAISHLIQSSQTLEKKYKNDDMTESDFEDFIELLNKLNETINTNLKKTAQLVNSFKQISVDQTSEDIRKFSLNQYIEEILLSLSNTTNKYNVLIDIKSKEDIILNSYAGLFSQIFTNLVLNSINHGFKYKNDGIIDIELIKEENIVKIIYKDNGEGISDENINKIFDPFFTTNRNSGGTGLGLNVVYNIVTNNLKGSIKCETNQDEGVTFLISFPFH